jgi:hypothetical protein
MCAVHDMDAPTALDDANLLLVEGQDEVAQVVLI